jgi:3-dehydroquinate synthase
MLNNTVTVKLGSDSYPIYIEEELISKVGKIIEAIGSYQKVIIVTDRNVARLHLKELEKSFFSKKIRIEKVILPTGENTKSFYHLNFLLNKMLSFKIDRQSLIVSFGGGVIGDLVGLAASIILRGLDYIQIPTTLLSQVDSSVGGKTAINTAYGKNLVGTFKQPKAVISSLSTLRTLRKREIRSGYAEIIKYALIRDKIFFSWLQKNGLSLLSLDYNSCGYAIKKSCLIKSEIVSLDEKENGIRALLNLGHTFGHVLESVNKYSKTIQHGEAVLVGIMLAIKLSVNLNFSDKNIIEECENHFNFLKLKYRIKDFKLKVTMEKFIELLSYDKKIKNGKINFILLKRIGEGFIYDQVKKKDLVKLLKKELN